MHKNNQWLRRAMVDHDLTRKEVASMLCVSTPAVDRWLQPYMKSRKKNPTYRKMPDMAVELMKVKIKAFTGENRLTSSVS